MVVRIVRLGTERSRGEGLRIGTVRRPPRGVPKSEFASQDWYDVWLPNLAPSQELMKLGQAVETDGDWKVFAKKYRAETADPDRSRVLDLLAALSHRADFSVGCYCEDEDRCHRSLLRRLLLLLDRGATFEGMRGSDNATAGRPMKLRDLEDAFLFVGEAAFGEHAAMICLETGEVCLRSEMAELDEIPEEAYESDQWREVPDKRELGLGRDLVLSFVAERLPEDLDRVRRIFRHPGAYASYKDLLEDRGILEEWYEFENARVREAILEWCRRKGIEVTE